MTLRGRILRGEPLESTRVPIPEPVQAPTSPLFAEFAWKWFDTYARTHNRFSEQYKKRCQLRRHLVPAFGALRLDEIRTVLVDEYKARKLNEGLSAKSVNNQLAILGKCLRCAHDWEVIERVPKIRLLPLSETPFEFLTTEEAQRLMADDREPVWNSMVRLALSTGMRLGELQALDWRDIDLERGVVTVSKSYVLGVVGPTKNGRSRRIGIPIERVRELAARRSSSGVLFPGVHGRPCDKKSAQKALTRICARAGVRRVTWHVLRHTFATLLLRDGVSLQVIQALLGHATIQMTTRYAHVSEDLMSEAVRMLAARYGGDRAAVDSRRSTPHEEDRAIQIGNPGYSAQPTQKAPISGRFLHGGSEGI